MKMDMSQYLDVFLGESKEHLESLNQRLLELEKDAQNVAALNEIFRAAHTLKGMSSTMGFYDLADLTHHMENVLTDLKEGVLKVDPAVVDIIFRCFDRIQLIIDKIENEGSGEMDNSELITILENVKIGNYDIAAVSEPGAPVGEQEEAKPFEGAGQESSLFTEYDITVLKEAANSGYQIINTHISIEPSCLMKSVRAFMVFKAVEEDGEVIKSMPSAQDLEEGKFNGGFQVISVNRGSVEEIQRRLENISEVAVDSISEIQVSSLVAGQQEVLPQSETSRDQAEYNGDSKRGHKVKQTVRVDIERLDNLMNLVGELVMHKGRLEQISTSQKIAELNETMEQLDRVTTDLQSVVMKVRMVPIEQVFNRFPRMVRDLAKDLNKEIEFVIEGKETELDRTVIDEVGDPLVHLLRNAIDHGLESSEERVSKGKPRQGTVLLRARHEGNNVYIEVADDGAGIDSKRVTARAVEKGLISLKEAEMLTPEEATDLLFLPGFSTAENITDISGRGVGLDVVKNKIEAINGEIFVDSKVGQGTKFRIKLPLTLAIIQALLIAIGNETYAIPLSSVDETTMIACSDIKMVQDQEVIILRGNVLPLYRLAALLDIPGESNKDEMYVVVVRKAEKQIGLVVDGLIGQQEIVIKSLGKLLAGIPGIAGAIVSGDGNVRLILDIATLI